MVSVDLEKYEKLLKAVGSMSRLYSDNNSPYINSRFVEKLYVFSSSATDFARKDMSFDAQTKSGAGVGVKTFAATSFTQSKREKVAEFTNIAARGEFLGLSSLELAQKVSEFRNARITSDARIYEIDLTNSIYHCLVRANGGCLVHEEPYSLIDIDSIKVEESKGAAGSTRFTDGISQYSFSISKNTLMKDFKLSSHLNSRIVEIEFIEDIFSKLLGEHDLLNLLTTGSVPEHLESVIEEEALQTAHVVLPLYSTRTHSVEPKSGINQWNAGGREREFGEAYIPIPKEIRRRHESFFPPKDVPFKLRMPDATVIDVKVCQADGKALMSNPNKVLCDWLFRLIDDSEEKTRSRLAQGVPYTTADLVRIGQDSVQISLIDPQSGLYELQPMSLGSYDRFVQPEEPGE